MNAADTAWILVATALVLFMTLPGLALFYGGLVRARNVLSVFMQCISVACLISVLWLILGYTIAFGHGGGWIGGLDKAFLSGIDATTLRNNLPEVLFFAFQMTFAIITPALIIGAYVERIRFGFVLAFSGLWMVLCYAPVAHWVWGGGWLAALGVKDFAGGIVVHETAGLSALVVAWFLGPRRDRSKPPHNPGFVMLGASMLWVGWFGFNGGSQLAADGTAAMAVVVTHISAAAASLSWAGYEWIKHGKPSMVGLVTGTIAGLASITPASGYVGPLEALVIGLVAGVLCQEACRVVKSVLKIDDTLDVMAVHGVGGIFGTIMIAVFGHGSWSAQLAGLGAVALFTLAVTTIVALACRSVLPFRVDAEDEITGLDYVSHGERGYELTS
ncbi:MAG: ammonium transporter [Alphaproteobacteria bacterium]|nr:MAG: ammonium transporter [Alphaproteobacteria bacterium]